MKKIESYQRDFNLSGGKLVLGISLVSAFILFVFGAIKSRYWFEPIILVIYVAAAASVVFIGYIISKFLDIQNAKLELMEMQTELMLKEEERKS